MRTVHTSDPLLRGEHPHFSIKVFRRLLGPGCLLCALATPVVTGVCPRGVQLVCTPATCLPLLVPAQRWGGREVAWHLGQGVGSPIRNP